MVLVTHAHGQRFPQSDHPYPRIPFLPTTNFFEHYCITFYGMSSSCQDIERCRTKFEILSTCFSTILLCAWVVIHPNIPAMDEGVLPIVFRRIGLVVLTAIAPELVGLLAIRQWILAGRLRDEYRKFQVSFTMKTPLIIRYYYFGR